MAGETAPFKVGDWVTDGHSVRHVVDVYFREVRIEPAIRADGYTWHRETEFRLATPAEYEAARLEAETWVRARAKGMPASGRWS